MGNIAKIIPLIDHLYIFQLHYYKSKEFFKWFLNNPFARNLQRKHRYTPTIKSSLILLVSISQLSVYIVTIYFLTKNFLISAVFLLLVLQLSPVLIILSNTIITPIDSYFKKKVIAQAILRRTELKTLKVVAIVGSFAKTSTKEILYTLLWKDFYTVKTAKSFNTEVSLARSLLNDVKETTNIFISEMDTFYPGEITKLCKIVKPNLGIITAIAKQHLERFHSMEELAKSQFELADCLPQDSLLFLNTQNSWINLLEPNYKNKKIYYGQKGNDFYASNISQTSTGIWFDLHHLQTKVKIELPLFGEHQVINFLAAAAIAHSLGLSLRKIADRARFILPTKHRLEIVSMGKYRLIDNTFNANATSYISSFKLLRDLPGSQRIILTPGLVELGKEQSQVHQEMGQAAAKVADLVVIIGENAKQDLLLGLANGGFAKEKIVLVKSTKEALDLLPAITKENSVVLLENDLPDQYF